MNSDNRRALIASANVSIFLAPLRSQRMKFPYIPCAEEAHAISAWIDYSAISVNHLSSRNARSCDYAARGLMILRRKISMGEKYREEVEMIENHIRAVVFQEGDIWVAQCLEYDISAQASDLDTLRRRFQVALEAECDESVSRNHEPFAGIDPAPAHFHEMWEKRSQAFQSVPHSVGVSATGVSLALCA